MDDEMTRAPIDGRRARVFTHRALADPLRQEGPGAPPRRRRVSALRHTPPQPTPLPERTPEGTHDVETASHMIGLLRRSVMVLAALLALASSAAAGTITIAWN